jgi:hypothetical protein
MSEQIHAWLATHKPVSTSYKQFTKVPDANEMANCTTGVNRSNVISIARLAGDAQESVLAADEALNALYLSEGAQSQAFIEAFAKASTTAVATILDMARLRASFDPSTGNDSLTSFNAYMASVGAFPLLTHDKANSGKLEKSFDHLPDLLTELQTLMGYDDEQFISQLSAAIPTKIDETAKLDIYLMQLSSNTPTQFVVSAATVTFTTTKKEKRNHRASKSDCIEYRLLCSHYNLAFTLEDSLWNDSWAKKISEHHFATIDQWIKASSLDSLSLTS